jgi:hypothetical protein
VLTELAVLNPYFTKQFQINAGTTDFHAMKPPQTASKMFNFLAFSGNIPAYFSQQETYYTP